MPASEQAFLECIDRHFPNSAPGVVLARGDDCAILEAPSPGGRLCLSTDLFVEHQHFRRAYFTPQDIGHKALAAAASDLAAMGAAPVGFALSLMLSPADDDAFLDALLSGMAALSSRLGLPLIGGDLSLGPALALDITVLGKPTPGGRLLRRGMAQPGDALVVVGPIGLARAGLSVLEANGRAALGRWPAATAAHLSPVPLIPQGQTLAGIAAVRGLMDVSDGLARDVPRFVGPYGADIRLASDALHPDVREYSAQQGSDAAEEAILGGEDYALLAAIAPEGLTEVLAALPEAYVLGHVAGQPGLRLNGRPFSKAGFDHFGTQEGE